MTEEATKIDSPGAPAETPAAPTVRDLPPGRHWFWGTGRRKTSVARVRIRPGDGKYLINERQIDDYFSEVQDRADMVAPLKVTKTEGRIDVHVRVHGGGSTGQAGAIRLGLSRALKEYDPSLEAVLRDEGFLTVDDRQVERKKYGQRGARRRFQFSKR
jgi:small subunit ribosomal protein S9